VDPPTSVSPVLCVALVLDVEVLCAPLVLDVEVGSSLVWVVPVFVVPVLVELVPVLVVPVLAPLDASTVPAPGEAGPQAVSPKITSSVRVAATPARMASPPAAPQARIVSAVPVRSAGCPPMVAPCTNDTAPASIRAYPP
jgi:hypothetical protein